MAFAEYCGNCDKRTLRKVGPCPECTPEKVEPQKPTTNTHITQALREIAAEMEKEVSLMSVPEGSEVRSYIRKWAQQLRNV
jgi:hypothetical protein